MLAWKKQTINIDDDDDDDELPMLDWTHKQRYARKGIRYRRIFRVIQILNHYPAKTQAEIQQSV